MIQLAKVTISLWIGTEHEATFRSSRITDKCKASCGGSDLSCYRTVRRKSTLFYPRRTGTKIIVHLEKSRAPQKKTNKKFAPAWDTALLSQSPVASPTKAFLKHGWDGLTFRANGLLLGQFNIRLSRLTDTEKGISLSVQSITVSYRNSHP